MSGWSGGKSARGADPHHALPHHGLVLHARHHLLADEAALVEVDAVEQVEIGLVRKGVAERIVVAGLGHAEGDAVGVVVGGWMLLRFTVGRAAIGSDSE